jgi:hypothetical protein
VILSNDQKRADRIRKLARMLAEMRPRRRKDDPARVMRLSAELERLRAIQVRKVDHSAR